MQTFKKLAILNGQWCNDIYVLIEYEGMKNVTKHESETSETVHSFFLKNSTFNHIEQYVNYIE